MDNTDHMNILMPCVHRGDALGITPAKKCCGKTTDVPLYSCNVLGKCTLSKKAVDESIATCKGCPHRTTDAKQPTPAKEPETPTKKPLDILRDNFFDLSKRATEARKQYDTARQEALVEFQNQYPPA